MATNTAVAQRWDALAETYAHEVYSLTATPEKRQHLVSRLARGQRVLIVGCGSETYLQRHILAAHEDITVHACDLSQGMIEAASRDFSHRRVTYRREDTTCLSFGAAEFDVVLSTNSIIPECREDVARMYAEIARVLRPGGLFLAFLPSFECASQIAARIAADLALDVDTVLAGSLDERQARVFETSGWQCYHTPALIEAELSRAGFAVAQVEQIGVESDEEYRQVANVYGSTVVPDLLREYLVVARRDGAHRFTGEGSTAIDAGLQLQAVTPEQLTPALVSELSDYYRGVFNVENGHFLVYPSTGEVLPPEAVLGERQVSLQRMDSSIEYPRHPETGERAVLFHDPERTRRKLSTMLASRACAVVLRESASGKVVGLTFQYEAPLETVWENEWSHRFAYAADRSPLHERSFAHFLEAVRAGLRRAGLHAQVDGGTSLVCWNCSAVDRTYRNLEVILKMTARLHGLAAEQRLAPPRFALLESVVDKPAYLFLCAAGALEVPDVLDAPVVLMVCEPAKVRECAELPVPEISRRMARYLADRRGDREQTRTSLAESSAG